MRELKGMPVVKAMTEKLTSSILMLKEKGIIPKLAVIRVGEKEDDLAYESGILRRFGAANALVEVFTLPLDCTQSDLEDRLIACNEDKNVHGILIFRPLPRHLSEERLKSIIIEAKDVDGMGISSMAHVFAGSKAGYPPCTPQAVIELLDHYEFDIAGENITIVGRSMVVGKPLAMLLLGRNATVTVCHTKTVDLPGVCRKAEILISCAGVPRFVKEDFVHPGQVVIDVGINMVNGQLCGDVDYEHVANQVQAITPVPGGIGTVTTSVLLKHTVLSALSNII